MVLRPTYFCLDEFDLVGTVPLTSRIARPVYFEADMEYPGCNLGAWWDYD